jgi:hypothetical protein
MPVSMSFVSHRAVGAFAVARPAPGIPAGTDSS